MHTHTQKKSDIATKMEGEMYHINAKICDKAGGIKKNKATKFAWSN